MSVNLIPESIRKKFDVFDWRNGLALWHAVRKEEFNDVVEVLEGFEIKWSVLTEKGRNKTEIASLLDSQLYAKGWLEKLFDTKILVDDEALEVPTHKIDCFKGRVALEVEWNNKDPFFDRDLNNFRLLYELRVIDLGVIITRSTEFQKWLHANHKMLLRDTGTYGASTTHFDKLKSKIEGGGAGGCPVVVFSIRTEAYVDDRPDT